MSDLDDVPEAFRESRELRTKALPAQPAAGPDGEGERKAREYVEIMTANSKIFGFERIASISLVRIANVLEEWRARGFK